MIGIEEGMRLVKAARNTVFYELKMFDGPAEKRGIFVTINTHPEKKLRGCIGFPVPVMPLNEAVVKAARAAAFSDPRFDQVKKKEEKKVVFEVSILTVPELIKVNDWKEYKDRVHIGKDGLIVDAEGFSGLLLPQVFPEHKVDAERALNMTCIKAGLIEDTWKQPGCKVYKFQAQIFAEESPNGEIKEIRP